MKSLQLGFGFSAVLLAAVAGCAPQRVYRAPVVRPSSSAPVRPPFSEPTPVPPSPSTETFKSALPQDPDIKEHNLKPPPTLELGSALPPRTLDLGPPLPPLTQDPSDPVVGPEGRPSPAPPPLPDDSSLLAKITPGVTPQRAASLRLTDEGSKLLDAGETARALSRLERTIVIDSTNPYGYFYLAKAHFRLGRYRESLNFLNVAEPRLSGELFWLAEVHALRGENYRALGQLQRAQESYAQALRLNSGNRTAAEALQQLRVETPSTSR